MNRPRIKLTATMIGLLLVGAFVGAGAYAYHNDATHLPSAGDRDRLASARHTIEQLCLLGPTPAAPAELTAQERAELHLAAQTMIAVVNAKPDYRDSYEAGTGDVKVGWLPQLQVYLQGLARCGALRDYQDLMDALLASATS